MALHPDFPSSPFDVLDPEVRWFPADETLRDRGNAEIRDTIKLRKTRPFVVKDQAYLIPKKCVFNRVIGDSPLELWSSPRFLSDARTWRRTRRTTSRCTSHWTM